MFGVIEDVDEKQKAIAVYCRKTKDMRPAVFFDHAKHADQVTLKDWREHGRPYLLTRQWAEKQISNLPFTFTVYADSGNNRIFMVNNETLEVMYDYECVQIFTQTGALKGVLQNMDGQLICMEVC